MRSFNHDKSHQIWLWWAVDHATNTPLAYTFGTRKHKYLDELLTLLKPFNVGRVYADDNYAYRDKIPAEKLVTGKKNTQQIERNHLTLRTRVKRLCRKSICFSKNKEYPQGSYWNFYQYIFLRKNFGCFNYFMTLSTFKLAPVSTKAKLVKISLQMLIVQTVIRSANKGFSI